jgi:hypothetical protein
MPQTGNPSIPPRSSISSSHRVKLNSQMIFPNEIFIRITESVEDSMVLFRLSCCSKLFKSIAEGRIKDLVRLYYPWKQRNLKTSIAFAFYSQTRSLCRRCGRVASYITRAHLKRCDWCGPGCDFRHTVQLTYQVHCKGRGANWWKQNPRLLSRTLFIVKDVRFSDFPALKKWVVSAQEQCNGCIRVVALPRTDEIDGLLVWAAQRGYEPSTQPGQIIPLAA